MGLSILSLLQLFYRKGYTWVSEKIYCGFYFQAQFVLVYFYRERRNYHHRVNLNVKELNRSFIFPKNSRSQFKSFVSH